MKFFLILFTSFLSVSFNGNAKDVLEKGKHRLIHAGMVKRLDDDSLLYHLKKLTMHDDSTLLIDGSLAGRKLIIQIDDFTAYGRTLIYNTYTGKFHGRYSDKGQVIFRAKAGAKGHDTPGVADYREAGIPGGNGSNASHGRNSVELVLKLGIRYIEDLQVKLSSESGGIGGAGGRGQKGGSAQCHRSGGAGDGGRGGNGGKGGYPGDILPFKLLWWSHLPVLASRNNFPLSISLKIEPGVVGMPGNSGSGGTGGDGRSCASGLYSKPTGKQGPPGDIGPFVRSDMHHFNGDIGKISAQKILAPKESESN